MKTFTAFRPNIPVGTHDENQMNAPNAAQFEGIVFSDGTTVIKWLTSVHSTAVFASFEDLMKIHGHPEYGSYFIWDEGEEVDA
jgi:hypothetical protein